MKLRPTSRIATCVVVLLFLAPISAARADTVEYGLNDPTSYSHGCFGGLCLCPISLNPDVQGTAAITEVTSGGGTVTYDVTDVSWSVGQGAFSISLVGSGTYTRISNPAGSLHQLALELSVNGGAPIPFDSGLVEGGDSFPDIAISISNGIDPDADCIFGTILSVDTSPLSEEVLTCYRADLDQDLSVGFGDVLAVIAAWGPCGEACPEDLSGNNVVDFADILMLIGSWGPCS